MIPFRALGGMLDDLPDAVRIIDRERKVLFLNEAARIMGPNGLGHLCDGDRRGRDASCPECQLDRVFERGVFLRWHVTVPHQERAAEYYEVTLSPLRDDSGEIEAVLELLRDATVTLGLEQYLIGRAEQQDDELHKRAVETEKLETNFQELQDNQTEILREDRLAALNQVAASLAHEIHTPLGAMLASADLLQRTVKRAREHMEEGGSSDGKKLVDRLEAMEDSSEVMVEGARRLESIVKTLRLFSRLDEAQSKWVDLHEGLESTLTLLRYRTGDRVTVVREYGDVPRVFCQADACNQVFMNLLHNAVQAIPTEGTVRIRTWAEDGFANVEISDDGVGIQSEHRSRLFDLGFTTRSGQGGAGVGLALSSRIVRDHHGEILVRSDPGDGSTFTVRLPIEPQET